VSSKHNGFLCTGVVDGVGKRQSVSEQCMVVVDCQWGYDL